MGVGAVKRFTGIRRTVVERIVWAWIFTLPATALIGYNARTRDWNALSMNEPALAWAVSATSDPTTTDIKPNDYPFSKETEVAFITAKTLSPSFRFIRATELVVMIDVTIPAAVRMTTSDTTLSDTIFSIVPGKRFRILMLIVVRP
jgi:hypothetical protein